MKKFICTFCAIVLIAALTACSAGRSVDPTATNDSTPDVGASETAEPEATSEAAPEATEETEAKPTDTGIQDSDISSAIDPTTTSDTNAAALGEWVRTARYATEDKTYHTVYVRITKITTATDDADYVQSAVDLHNDCSYDFSQIDTSALTLPSDVELCVLEYEVFVPDDFPAPDYGMVEPTMDFSESNIGGGGIPSADGASSYIGLGTNTTDLATEKDPTYYPGNTYSFRALFTMVKGYTDYVLEFTSYPEGTVELSADVMYHAYFANK